MIAPARDVARRVAEPVELAERYRLCELALQRVIDERDAARAELRKATAVRPTPKPKAQTDYDECLSILLDTLGGELESGGPVVVRIMHAKGTEAVKLCRKVATVWRQRGAL